MSATPEYECAVCPRLTNQCCSGCKRLYFCSRECQKFVSDSFCASKTSNRLTRLHRSDLAVTQGSLRRGPRGLPACTAFRPGNLRHRAHSGRTLCPWGEWHIFQELHADARGNHCASRLGGAALRRAFIKWTPNGLLMLYCCRPSKAKCSHPALQLHQTQHSKIRATCSFCKRART